MKFLLDMNMPRGLRPGLQQRGHAVRHAADAGLMRAEDQDLIEEARRELEVILTHDLDFGFLLAFSGYHDPSIVIVRLRQMSAQRCLEVMDAHWKIIEPAILKGSIVILDDAAVRVRPLPIEPDTPEDAG